MKIHVALSMHRPLSFVSSPLAELFEDQGKLEIPAYLLCYYNASGEGRRKIDDYRFALPGRMKPKITDEEVCDVLPNMEKLVGEKVFKALDNFGDDHRQWFKGVEGEVTWIMLLAFFEEFLGWDFDQIQAFCERFDV